MQIQSRNLNAGRFLSMPPNRSARHFSFRYSSLLSPSFQCFCLKHRKDACSARWHGPEAAEGGRRRGEQGPPGPPIEILTQELQENARQRDLTDTRPTHLKSRGQPETPGPGAARGLERQSPTMLGAVPRVLPTAER